MSFGGPRRAPISGRQHLLNLACSLVVGIASLAVTRDLTWGIVAFLVSGILIHTLLLNARFGQK